MQKGTRCAKACSPCRKRKERCPGGRPCNQCIRRAESSLCQYIQGTDEHISKKRRKKPNSPNPIDCGIHVPSIVHTLRLDHDDPATVSVGDSSTLGLFTFVRNTARYMTEEVDSDDEEYDIILETKNDPMCLDPFDYLNSTTPEIIEQCLQIYLDFVCGIFDIFTVAELQQNLSAWSKSESQRSSGKVPYSAMSLILAIGAEQLMEEKLSHALFVIGYKRLSEDLLDPPTLALLQALLLLVLYLLLKCRRNTAMLHLGSAIQASHAIGLNTLSKSCITDAQARAWKCLRILDVSSCASLGRPLGTFELTLPRSISEEDKVDFAGLRLCSIADKILRTVYGEKKLSAKFALAMSEELKDWADHIPGILTSNSATTTDVPRMPLSKQLCSNHMTAAYYWTIILLTRPFLMNEVLSRTRKKSPECTIDTSHTVLIDACINSAFRCLNATTTLSQYSDLPPKLFLVINTTFVSALVLVLAFFGDYDKTFPLGEGLEKAICFLQRLSRNDLQAAQYLRFVRSLQKATTSYTRRRAVFELERRGVQVDAVFGSVDRVNFTDCATWRPTSCTVPSSIPEAIRPPDSWQATFDQLSCSPDQTDFFDDWGMTFVHF